MLYDQVLERLIREVIVAIEKIIELLTPRDKQPSRPITKTEEKYKIVDGTLYYYDGISYKTERQQVCDEIIEGLKTYSTLFGTYGLADIMNTIKRVRNK